ncbi:MAG TPA: long-chain fatty acid--CoA ligase [Anaeromyxobacteraceae bacterium]|nr:long-chain fatty acid--CoA ligase [Anaeromyxobacteraceae bacterium]
MNGLQPTPEVDAAAVNAPQERPGPRESRTAPAEVPRGAASIPALVERAAAAHPTACAARSRRDGRWVDASWTEVAQRVRRISDGLAALGVRPGDRVAVLSETRLEAVLAQLAVLAARAVAVPVYPSELPRQVRHLLGTAGATWAFCDGSVQADKLESIRGELPALQGAIRFDGPTRGPFERTLADLEREGDAFGRAHPGAHGERVRALRPDDVACVIFTSGTTGVPKGVVLSHDAWLYCAAAYPRIGILTGEQVALMFLPLAHVMGWMVVACWIQSGATLAFAQSVEKVLDDAAATHPTCMAAPPRLFEKAFGGIVSKGLAAPGLKGRLFKRAMAAFEEWVTARDAGRQYSSLDLTLGKALVFPRIAAAVRERFGGRMQLLISGSAPLSSRVQRFFELIGMPILQGYGLTECAGTATATPPACLHTGTVGPPLPGGEIRLAPDGEILIRNPALMRGYWQDPAATAAALEDGWLHTGDIGELDGDGCVRITDRKKDLIKTSGGKYVAPQLLEAGLRADALVSNAMIHGDGRRFVSALVALNEENVRRWAEAAGVPLEGPLAENPRVHARIQAVVDALNGELPRYATVKRFAIVPDFSVAAGDLTPTMKLRRKAIAERHRAVLDAFYVEDPTLH